MTTTKQLHLHIGRAKVGSTALQNFLWINRRELAQKGVLYPESPLHHQASHKLALVFQPDLIDARCVEGQDASAIYDAMFEEADKARLSRIVASTENLFTVDPAKPARYIPRAWKTKIVCYVRRQDEVLASSYIQELKTGDLECADIEEYASNPVRAAYLDYGRVLDAWSAQFGEENIIVRVAEKGQLRGSMFEDFLAVLGLDAAGIKFPEGRLNSSPARDILDFIQIVNAAPVPGRVMKHLLRQPLLDLSDRLGAPGPYSPSSVIPAKLRRKLLKRFADSNAAVARKYLRRKDGRLFADDNIEGDSDPYTGLELQRFAHMVASLFGAQQQRLLRLQRQIDELNRVVEKLTAAQGASPERRSTQALDE